MIPTLAALVKRGVSPPTNSPDSRLNRGVARVEAADMERLSGKLLIDTYSKRSQTLIEKVPTLSSADMYMSFIFIYIFIGQRIREVDGRVRDNLHC